MSDSRTVAGAYAKIEAHEDICAVRYEQINATLAELRKDVSGQYSLLWGIVLSVGGCALVTLVAVVLHAVRLA